MSGKNSVDCDCDLWKVKVRCDFGGGLFVNDLKRKSSEKVYIAAVILH